MMSRELRGQKSGHAVHHARLERSRATNRTPMAVECRQAADTFLNDARSLDDELFAPRHTYEGHSSLCGYFTIHKTNTQRSPWTS